MAEWQYWQYILLWWLPNSGHLSSHDEYTARDGQDHWQGPCTIEIGEYSGITWDATVNYNPWQIVEHNGEFWIAQDRTMQGDEPNHDVGIVLTCRFLSCDELIECQTSWYDTSILVTAGGYEFCEFAISTWQLLHR